MIDGVKLATDASQAIRDQYIVYLVVVDADREKAATKLIEEKRVELVNVAHLMAWSAFSRQIPTTWVETSHRNKEALGAMW